jgi:hypothetical protein
VSLQIADFRGQAAQMAFVAVAKGFSLAAGSPGE